MIPRTSYPDSERFIIAATLLEPVVSLECCHRNCISAESFTDADCALAWRAVMHFAAMQTFIDPVSLATEMAKHSGATQGWMKTLCGWIDSCHTPTTLPHHVELVRDAEIRRKLVVESGAMRQASETSNDAAGIILSNAITDLLAVRTVADEAQTPQRVYADLMGHWRDSRGKGHTGTPSRWGALNRMIGGYRPGKLYIIAARPGCGKSTFMGNETLSWAMRGVPVAFASIEMVESELRGRMLADASDVSSYKMDIGEGAEQDFERLEANVSAHEALPIRICDRGMTIEQVVMWMTSEVVGHGAKMLLLDYIQIVSGSRRHESRNVEVSEWMNVLRDTAKRLNVAMLIASQLRRGEGDTSRPQLSELRDSGAIEQNAYAVIFLHHSKNQEQEQSEFIVAKNRGGPCGTIAMKFNRGRQRFEWQE